MEKEKKVNKVSDLASKALCAYIVSYRALGVNKQLSIECMQELAKREMEGDKFDYYSFIEEELAKIPKVGSLNYNNLFEVLKSTVAEVKKK